MNLHIDFLVLLTILAVLLVVVSGCSSYKMKIGKRCLDTEQGGQTWSRVWFVQEGVDFDEC